MREEGAAFGSVAEEGRALTKRRWAVAEARASAKGGMAEQDDRSVAPPRRLQNPPQTIPSPPTPRSPALVTACVKVLESPEVMAA